MPWMADTMKGELVSSSMSWPRTSIIMKKDVTVRSEPTQNRA